MFLICCLTLIVISSMSFCPVAKSARCLSFHRHPRDTKLKFQPCPVNGTAYRSSPEVVSPDYVLSYLLMAAEREDYVEENALKLEEHYSKRIPKKDEDLCSGDTILGINSPPEFRSDCPFTWERNTKPDRFPEVLMEVKCLCTQPKANQTWHWNHDNVKIGCEEVKYTLPVLWRERCVTEINRYRLGFDTISLACFRTVSATRDPGQQAITSAVTMST